MWVVVLFNIFSWLSRSCSELFEMSGFSLALCTEKASLITCFNVIREDYTG